MKLSCMPLFLLVLPLLFCGAPLAKAASSTLPNSTGCPDALSLNDSWHLWLDQKAEWKDDPLYLPDEVDLKTLPVNPPTGGWEALNDQSSVPVTLPGTVEEHFWGRAPLPVAKSDSPDKIITLESAYTGVSWWFRKFTPPALKPGERLILSFPGARLRAEVYVNGKLVGYNLVNETPFTADATAGLRQGAENKIAVRITNPGGNFNWVDYGLMKWGKYTFHVSHAFGGLDGGVTMAVHGPVAVEDLFLANHPNPRTITLTAQIASSGPAYKGPLMLSISRAGKEIWHGAVDADVPAGKEAAIAKEITVPDAELWDIGHPAIYRAEASIPKIAHSGRVTDFGFRWFTAEGMGSNPKLVLNGRRIVMKASISWGFWAPNGMFPDGPAVEREISAAKALGLNCIQNHRHFPKAAVMDGFDNAGLFRYCECGGGGGSFYNEGKRFPRGPIDTSGKGGEPTSFTQRYATVKLLSMVKAYRSHPSALLWTVQNETGESLNNPSIFWILRQMHALDPSRIVLLKSGFNPNGEVMGLPYSNELTYGDKEAKIDSGWDDTHTCNDFQGVYCDGFYKNPTDFPYYTTNTTGISVWGEMATGASVDDVTAMARWYRAHNVPGYDREAAETLSTAYDKFLDQYGFRASFPTTETLFRQIGAKHFFSAAKVMENARMADQNDYIVLSGWESTTVDNHCALVDALRHPKGNPDELRAACAPELLVVRLRNYVVAPGTPAVADVHIANETGLKGNFSLQIEASLPGAKPFFQNSFPVKVTGGDVFGELLKDNIAFVPPTAGPITVRASLLAADSSKAVLERTEPLLAVNPQPAPLNGPIACADYNGKSIPRLKELMRADAIPLEKAPREIKTLLITSEGVPHYALDQGVVNPQRCSNVTNTDDPGLYEASCILKQGELAPISGLAPGPLNVELFFVEPYWNEPDRRLFDVALNGKVVLRNFDIAKAAGGKAKAVVQKLSTESADGALHVSIPRIGKDKALMTAIRVTDSAGKVTRQVLRRKPYRSTSGETWEAAPTGNYDWSKVLPPALERVKTGSRLVMLTMGGEDAAVAAEALAEEKVLKFMGSVGPTRTSWMGYWYFSRKQHWLMEGLPSGCVLDWPFQAAAGGAGLKIEAPGMEPVIAMGVDHGATFSFGATVIPVGRGQIVLLAIPGLSSAVIDGNAEGFQPLAAQRLLFNALSGK